jgi:hypothetical protein
MVPTVSTIRTQYHAPKTTARRSKPVGHYLGVKTATAARSSSSYVLGDWGRELIANRAGMSEDNRRNVDDIGTTRQE